MNETPINTAPAPPPQVQPIEEDPRVRRKQRMTDAFAIGSVQAGAMNIEFFNRVKR